MSLKISKLFFLPIAFFFLTIPISSLAYVLPDDQFVLYKDGKPVADYDSVVYSCDVPEVDDQGREFNMKFCSYSGNIDPGLTTIYQVENNKSKEIWNPTYGIPEENYLVKLEEYYEELIPQAKKSITVDIKSVDIKSSDGIVATSEDRYYSVDIDTGQIAFIGNNAPKVATTTKPRCPVITKGAEESSTVHKVLSWESFIPSGLGILIIFLSFLIIRTQKKQPWSRNTYFVPVSLIVTVFLIEATYYFLLPRIDIGKNPSSAFIVSDQESKIPDGWLSYDDKKRKLHMRYPSNWKLYDKKEGYIAFYPDGCSAEVFEISINDKYAELACMGEYCISYKGEVRDKKIILEGGEIQNGKKLFLEPDTVEPEGFRFTTDNFTFEGNSYQVTFYKFEKSSREETEAAKYLFEKVVSTITFQ